MLPGERDLYEASFRRQCDAMGSAQVRNALAAGRFNERKAKLARAWLDEHETAAVAAEREIDRNIQREANDIARRALNRATWANAIAAFALLAALAALAGDLFS